MIVLAYVGGVVDICMREEGAQDAPRHRPPPRQPQGPSDVSPKLAQKLRCGGIDRILWLRLPQQGVQTALNLGPLSDAELQAIDDKLVAGWGDKERASVQKCSP